MMLKALMALMSIRHGVPVLYHGVRISAVILTQE